MRTPLSDPRERAPDEPAEGRPDMDQPGADVPGSAKDPEGDLPERLGERIGDKPGGIAAGEPDLLPDVEVPEASM